MPEETREVKFAAGEHIHGEILVKGEEISAVWFEWYTADQHRILQAMGKVLGFPVEDMGVHDAGNGHMSAKLRRATPEEAAIQVKIAACDKVDYWEFPPYPRLDAMRAELGDAFLHAWGPGKEIIFAWTWAVDISKVNKAAFFEKWTGAAIHDCIRAAEAGDWISAYLAAMVAFCYEPRGARDAEAAALYLLSAAKQRPEKEPAHSEDLIIMLCRSHGRVYAEDLQRQLDKYRNLFGFQFPEENSAHLDMFNVRKVVCNFLRSEPDRRRIERKLREIAEGE